MDYLTGTSVADLAVRESLSEQRIYQYLNKIAFQVMGSHSITHCRKDQRFISRLHDQVNQGYEFRVQSGTPEAFFYELLREERQADYS